MDTNLIAIRLKSFGWEILGLAVTGLAGFLLSSDVQALINEHFGSTLAGSLIVLVVTGIGKHLRNVKLQNQLGSASFVRPDYI